MQYQSTKEAVQTDITTKGHIKLHLATSTAIRTADDTKHKGPTSSIFLHLKANDEAEVATDE